MSSTAVSRRSVLVIIGVLALFVSAAWTMVNRSDNAVAASATPVVYIATGENFPDALGVGPASALARGPILFVTRTSVPSATQRELSRLQPDRIILVGGTAVISPAVASQLGAWAPVTRIAGSNRYETAAAVSRAAFPAAPINSGPTAAGAGGKFVSAANPIILHDKVWTEVGKIDVSVPASGGTLSVTSQVQLHQPTGEDGAFVLLSQTIDGACGGSQGLVNVVSSDLTTSVYEVVPMSTTGGVSRGSHTIRTCAEAFQLVSTQTTEVPVSQISAVWAPSSMGGSSFDASSIASMDIVDLIDDMEARVAAMQASAPKPTDG